MRVIGKAGIGLFLAILPSFGLGCASLSPKLYTLPSIARHRAESQYQTARQAECNGQFIRARDLYSALQRQSPNNVEFAHRMAVVCTCLGEHETATRYFEHARQLAPRDAAVLADMGYAAILQRDYARAETLLRESVQYDPNDARAVNNMAMAIGFQGRDEECLQTFRRVNSEPQALIDVAYIHTQRGELERAAERYHHVLKLEPDNQVAKNALVQLAAALPPVSLAELASQSNTEADSRLASASANSAPSTTDLPSPLAVAAPKAQVAARPSSRDWFENAELPIIGNASTETTPVISQTADLPLLNDDAEAAEIRPESPSASQPSKDSWASSNDSTRGFPRVTPASDFDSEFQLPKQLDRPAELASDDEGSRTSVQHGTATDRDELAGVFEGDDNAPDRVIPDSNELVGLEWAADDIARRASELPAATASTVSQGEGLKGYCPVALRDERRLAPVSDEFSFEYQAQIYKFSSAEALARFLEHPEFYVPAAGGLDIIQVRRGDAVVQGSLDHAVWFRHRLHLFSNAENLATFRAAPREFALTP